MNRVSLIALIVGTVLPLLVAAVTKASWPESLKAVVLAFFSALTGVGTALQSPSHASASTILANALTTFVTGAAVAAGTWKPTGVIAKLEQVLVKDLPFNSPAPSSASKASASGDLSSSWSGPTVTGLGGSTTSGTGAASGTQPPSAS